MGTISRGTARGAIARILVIGLGLVVSSPLWHGTCHHVLLGSLIDDHGASRQIFRCDSSSHSAESLGDCPTCLSQRLLNHVQIEQAREASAPPRALGEQPARITAVAITLIDCRQPRAPPLA